MGLSFWPLQTVICRRLGLPGSYLTVVRSCGWRRRWLEGGCTISSWSATGGTECKEFHPYCRYRTPIHLEPQEDLAFEGCGRLVGRVFAQNSLWNCACSRGWLIVLHELPVVNRATLVPVRQLDVSVIGAGKIDLVLYPASNTVGGRGLHGSRPHTGHQRSRYIPAHFAHRYLPGLLSLHHEPTDGHV